MTGAFIGVDLAVEVGRDPAEHLVHLQQLGRAVQRRADDRSHCWTALLVVSGLWAAAELVPPDYEPFLGVECSENLRSMCWLRKRSPDAASWWRRMEHALADGPALVEGRPDGRRDLLFCSSCAEVQNAEVRGARFCLVCEGDAARPDG